MLEFQFVPEPSHCPFPKLRCPPFLESTSLAKFSALSPDLSPLIRPVSNKCLSSSQNANAFNSLIPKSVPQSLVYSRTPVLLSYVPHLKSQPTHTSPIPPLKILFSLSLSAYMLNLRAHAQIRIGSSSAQCLMHDKELRSGGKKRVRFWREDCVCRLVMEYRRVLFSPAALWVHNFTRGARAVSRAHHLHACTQKT